MREGKGCPNESLNDWREGRDACGDQVKRGWELHSHMLRSECHETSQETLGTKGLDLVQILEMLFV